MSNMEKGDQLIERIQTALQEVIRKMQAEMLKSMSAQGITLSQFIVLSLIQKQGSCKASQLAEHMDVKPIAVTFIMDRYRNCALSFCIDPFNRVRLSNKIGYLC